MTYWVRFRYSGISIFRRHAGKAELIPHKELDSINKRLKLGEAPDVCLALAKALKDRLRKEEKPISSAVPENLKVLEAAWKKKKKARLVDPYSAYRDLVRAAEALSTLSIETSAEEDLQHHFDSKYSGDTHRRLVAGVNQLLKFLERPFRLQGAHAESKPVIYMGLEQFLATLKDVEDPMLRNLIGCLFGTGVRYSEAFCLVEPKDGFVWVYRQFAWNSKTRKHEVRELKNKNPHWAFILPELAEYVTGWCAWQEKKTWRTKKTLRTVRKLLNLSHHELRHSYAIHLAGKGYSLTQIADNLGDSEAVTSKHYKGSIQSTPQMDLMKRMYRHE